jgi:capsular polysaccharide export protein
MSSVEAPLTDAVADDLCALLREARVGGHYWGSRPDLGPAPYVLGPSHVAVTRSADPWHLLVGASEVACVADDPLRLIAGLLGVPVRQPDSDDPARLLEPDDVRALLRTTLGPCLVCNPFDGNPMPWTEVINLSREWRELIDANRSIAAIYGFAGWKRATTEPLLWDGSDAQRHDRDPAALKPGQAVAVWRSRTSPFRLAELEAAGVSIVEVEDGFLRSAGLGANCVPPQSIVVDPLGIYFDGRSPSALEQLLQEGDYPPALVDRVDALRARITELGLSKYDAGHQQLERRSPKLHVLVPAQVEDDRAVLSTDGPPLSNLELLKRVRAARPDAYIVFKPHPDVEAGHRVGAVASAVAMKFADEIARDGSIASWIDLVDEVHVNSSLAGFEALMRGKAVTTHGVPFYAGWGLTTDLGFVPARRSAKRSLSELAAASLLLYPRYVDPVTNLPCPPEVLVARMGDGSGGGAVGRKGLVHARRLLGWLNKRLHRNAAK